MPNPMLGFSKSFTQANCDLDALLAKINAAQGTADDAIADSGSALMASLAANAAANAAALAASNAQATALQASLDAAAAAADAAVVQSNLDLVEIIAIAGANAQATATQAAIDALAASNAAAAAQFRADAAFALAEYAVALAEGGGGGGGGAASFMSPRDYGVVGDGAADDTAAMQDASDAATAAKRMLYCDNMTIRLTGPVTFTNCPGILFDAVSHGDSGGPGFLVTGTGYTALTFNGYIQTFAACVYGTGNAANGVLFQGNLLSRVQHCRVFGLDGFLVKINKCYDSVFETISCEQGGNASNYMFGMYPDGDTCNMTHIMRLQCEKGNKKVIYIDASTLSCVIDNIHSEQATPDVLYDTWYLGGSRTTYTNARFAVATGTGTLKVVGGNTTITNLFTEGSVDVSVDPGNTTSEVTLINPEVMGTLHRTSGSLGGQVVVLGGLIDSLYDPSLGTGTTLPGFRFVGTHLLTCNIGFQTNFDPRLCIFESCVIEVLLSSSTHAAATFQKCQINECNDLLQGGTVLLDCDVYSGSAIAVDSGILVTNGSRINANIVYKNATPIRGIATEFNGTITRGDAGLVNLMLDDSCRITVAGSSNIGIPTGGTHYVGDRHRNLLPAVGQPKAWVCTTPGGAGVFVFTSEGNL